MAKLKRCPFCGKDLNWSEEDISESQTFTYSEWLCSFIRFGKDNNLQYSKDLENWEDVDFEDFIKEE